jgi:predicted kinase
VITLSLNKNRSISARLKKAITNIKLAGGYREMAKINRQISEESIYAENDALAEGELSLTECENSDCEKRRHLLR